MSRKKLASLERELSHSYTENITLNRDMKGSHIKDAVTMLGNRALSLSLRRMLRMN